MKKTLNSLLVFLLALVVFIVPSRVEVEAAVSSPAEMKYVGANDHGVTGDITSKVNLEEPFTATVIGSVHLKDTNTMNPFNQGSIKVEISEGYIITKLSFSTLIGGSATVKIGENPNEDVVENKEFTDLNITSFSIQHKSGKASEFGAITITYEKDGMDVDIRATFDGDNADVVIPFSGLNYNDKITVDSGAHAGYEFAFWVVDGVVRHDLVNPNQTFYARNNLAAIAVYHPTDKHAEPNKWLSLTGSSSITNITENTVFKLQYERVTEETFTINLTNATQPSITANYNDIVTVTSDLVDFTHWEEDGKVVSYSDEYKFSALSNRDLVAKTGGVSTPLVTLGHDLGLRTGYISRVAQVELPVGYELLEYGYLISSSTDVLTIDNAIIANSSAMVDATNEYLTTFPSAYTDIRAYAIVIKGGVIEHVYSELDEFTVTFDLDGGEPAIAEQTITYGGLIEEPADPTKEGFVFLGWNLEDLTYDFSTAVTRNITLVAKWEELTSGTVEYTEDFSFVTSTSTAYTTSIQHTDTNGFAWDLLGMPGGADGFILGNSDDGSYIKVTATGGISSFSADIKKAFTNTRVRSVELFINGISKGEFDVDVNSDVAQTFTVNNINVAGEVVIELKSTSPGSRGAMDVESVSWKTYTLANDAEKLQIAKNELTEEFDGKSFDMDTTITLPKTSELGVGITWVLDPVDALVAGKWKVVTADTPVVLTATLTIGTETPIDVTLNVTILFVESSIVEEVTYSTGFENSTKASYAAATVKLDGVDWELNEALIGNLANDKFNGAKGLRIRNGFIESKETFASISKISFEAANYGTNTGGTLKIEVSSDGTTWILVEGEVTLSSDLTTYTFDVNEAGPLYVKITMTAGDRTNIDDLNIYSII